MPDETDDVAVMSKGTGEAEKKERRQRRRRVGAIADPAGRFKPAPNMAKFRVLTHFG